MPLAFAKVSRHKFLLIRYVIEMHYKDNNSLFTHLKYTHQIHTIRRCLIKCKHCIQILCSKTYNSFNVSINGYI